MKLDPVVAAILEASPALPNIQSIPLGEYRDLINRTTKSAPRLDLPLASVCDRAIDTGGQKIAVRIYTPTGEGPFPLLVYFHGGGFTIGDLEISDPICRALASGAECMVMSVDYRLAPEHPYPAPNDDCWNALRWASEHAAEIDADGSRIGVGGDSAGANLAASVALRARDAGLPLAAQLLLYPCPAYELDYPSYAEFADGPVLTLDDILFFWDQYMSHEVDRKLPDLAPLHAPDHRGLAPAFIGTGELDPTRDCAEAYGAKLKSTGCEVIVKRHAGLPHGFYSLVAHVPAVQVAMAELTTWLTHMMDRSRNTEGRQTGQD